MLCISTLLMEETNDVICVCCVWCLQLLCNTVCCVRCVKTLLFIQGLSSLQRERLFGFSCSPVRSRRQLCQISGTCQTTRLIIGKMHSQFPILKLLRGAQQPMDSYKIEQSCILHIACHNNFHLKRFFHA